MHVTLINPATNEVRLVKTGFSWVLFFFAPFYGIPLFIRGLHGHGMAVAAVGVAAALFQGTTLTPAIGLLLLAIMLFYGFKGNELTSEHLTGRGWYFANTPAEHTHAHFITSPATVVGTVETEAETAPDNSEQGKVCPRCAETVKAAAKICRHCGAPFASHGLATPYELQKSSGIGKGIAIAAGIFLFLILAGLLIETQDDFTFDTTGMRFGDMGSSNDAVAGPALVVTAKKLFEAYSANEQAAQAKYGNGRWRLVVGLKR